MRIYCPLKQRSVEKNCDKEGSLPKRKKVPKKGRFYAEKRRTNFIAERYFSMLQSVCRKGLAVKEKTED